MTDEIGKLGNLECERVIEAIQAHCGVTLRKVGQRPKWRRDEMRINWWVLGGMNLGCEGLRHFPKRAIAPAFTTAAETCSHWREHTMGPLGLIHDNSSNPVRDRWRSDLLTSPDIEQRTIGLPHRTRIYPLNVTRTEFADSRIHLQLQFCDLPAGATAAWCRKFLAEQHLGDYARQLEGAGIEELHIDSIWPQPEVDPEKLGTKGWSGEPLDFLAEKLPKLAAKARS